MEINQNKSLLFTKLAFEQAKINLGSTGTNPSVGCVVEKNGSVISSGFTSLNGRPHAEYNALNKNLDFKKSNIFISLEPCSHYGKTSPCTNIIKKKGIRKVSFSIYDIDNRSKNLAKKILNKKKISVKSGFLNTYAKAFYKDYFLARKKFLPLIDAKIAVSKDYFTKNKKDKRITNKHSIKRVHLLRSKYNCILSTSKTINDDNMFDINSINSGDSVGYATMTTAFVNITTVLRAGIILGQNYATINSYDSTGALLGFFTIENEASGVRVEVLGSPNDGNNYTSGYTSELYLTNLFTTPTNPGELHFFADINSELGDQIYASDTTLIWCNSTQINELEAIKRPADSYDILGRKINKKNNLHILRLSSGEVKKSFSFKKQ